MTYRLADEIAPLQGLGQTGWRQSTPPIERLLADDDDNDDLSVPCAWRPVLASESTLTG